MHASSLENMQRCYHEFLGNSVLLDRPLIRVLDIGGANVNGSYCDIFSDDKFEYTAVDLVEGPGVDVVLDDPYQFPFDDAAFDIVISGQAFEHAEFFWKLFEEMARVLSYDGFIFLIVPSSGPIHRYPVDCYRFYPDSMQALANYTKIQLASCWMDDRGPWNDLVGVFTYKDNVNTTSQLDVNLPTNRYMEQFALAPLFDKGASPDVEVTSGRVPYLDVLSEVHEVVQPRHYLEIGVRKGNSLSLSRCHSVAVDPEPDVQFELNDDQFLFKKTSDDFFREDAASVFSEHKPDLVFIDGMHLFEFALRDFINAERYSLANTLIVIDDVYPNHRIQAERQRQSRVWTGDIWKLHDCLKTMRPDLVLIPIDTAPTGLLLVAGLNSMNRVLSDQYNPLVRKYRGLALDSQEAAVIDRHDALAPDDSKIETILQMIKTEQDTPKSGFNVRLKQLLQPKLEEMTVGKKPLISLVVVSYNMARELPRTLTTLTAPYQQGFAPDEIELIVVDNGSNTPPNPASFPEGVRLLAVDTPSVSPVRAINIGIQAARADLVGVLIDGARMASPGLCRDALLASKLHHRPVISTLGFHLGSEVQMDSVEKGYCQTVEDELLESINWQKDGYQLFTVSVFAGSSKNGWFMPIAESNSLFLTKEMWNELDGYDDRFVTPGGGLVNLDTYVRACELSGTELITLLGEGTFHQVHGGIATNQKNPAASWAVFHEEYVSIRNKSFVKPGRNSIFLGKLPPQAHASIKLSAEVLANIASK